MRVARLAVAIVAVLVGVRRESIEQSGLTPEAWLDQVTWIVRPDPSCEFDAYWGVGSIESN